MREVFRRVTETYTSIRSYSAVVAVSPDPDPISHSRRWTPNLAHFICDVELRTAEALKDAPDLQTAWFSIIAGDAVDPAIEREVTKRCGRLYFSRGLDPIRYFRRGGGAE